MIINQANIAELWRSYRVRYEKAYQAAEPKWRNAAVEIPSSVRTNVYAWLASIPGMKKLVDVATINRLKAIKYSIENEEWEDTIEVPEFDIETDQYGIYNGRFEALGDVAAYHPDELVVAALCGGFAASALDYTGTPFFSANKKAVPESKFPFTNFGTNKLDRVAFRAGVANLIGRMNSQGRSMGLGRKLALVVGSKNRAMGLDILEGQQVNLTATFAEGQLTSLYGGGTNVDKGTAELVVWPAVDAFNPDFWAILERGFPGIAPIIHQVNLRARLNSCTEPNSEYVLTHHKFLFQAYGRYGAGYGLPELAYGSTGAGALGAKDPKLEEFKDPAGKK